MQKSGKIAVLGDRDSVELFVAAGADVYGASTEFEAISALKKLEADGYAVVFVTENVAALIPKQIDAIKAKPFPVVIPIPSAAGSNGFGMSGVKRDVEKAIGADILFSDSAK
ncbi:MAG: V-type ATP synthase subunit F [Clostridia bacterium]|nr:V-type ATP synthase subunit F [Clostridia bacterium]